jgi:hypothetical protein
MESRVATKYLYLSGGTGFQFERLQEIRMVAAKHNDKGFS